MPVHLDLGCGNNKREMSGWENIGIDIYKSDVTDHVIHLGFEKIPLSDNYVDVVTAYDVLEHIPRVVWEKSLIASSPYVPIYPFIDLLNEIYRVLRHGGVFIVECPFSNEAFNRDPTHVNRLGEDWHHYFQKEDNYYTDQGLVKCDFNLKEQTFRKYKWEARDIIHTELITKKEITDLPETISHLVNV